MWGQVCGLLPDVVSIQDVGIEVDFDRLFHIHWGEIEPCQSNERPAYSLINMSCTDLKASYGGVIAFLVLMVAE